MPSRIQAWKRRWQVEVCPPRRRPEGRLYPREHQLWKRPGSLRSLGSRHVDLLQGYVPCMSNLSPSIGQHSLMFQSGVAPGRLATRAPTAFAKQPRWRVSQRCSSPCSNAAAKASPAPTESATSLLVARALAVCASVKDCAATLAQGHTNSLTAVAVDPSPALHAGGHNAAALALTLREGSHRVWPRNQLSVASCQLSATAASPRSPYHRRFRLTRCEPSHRVWPSNHTRPSQVTQQTQRRVCRGPR